MSTQAVLNPPLDLTEFGAPPFDIPASSAILRTRDWRAIAAAYLELTKPRLVLMVLLTTAVGYWLGARGQSRLFTMLITLVGTALVASGACVWNQVLERVRDARMKRTVRRPLPSGRAKPLPSAAFGAALAFAGTVLLTLIDPLAGIVALATFLLYVLLYTPLKAITTLNTAIGAIPGALPPVIGWAAATGRLGAEAWALFLIVFLWQFPHFLAIAWIYRDDYRRAGMRMLPCVDPSGIQTSSQAVSHALLLLPAALLPAFVGLADPFYLAGALAVGLYYLHAAARFWREVSDRTARGLLRASFVYLPAVLLLLVANRVTG